MNTDAHRVAWQVEGDIRTMYRGFVEVYLPFILRLGGVLRNGIVEDDVQMGVFQLETIDLD
jgi:hypothetical protein